MSDEGVWMSVCILAGVLWYVGRVIEDKLEDIAKELKRINKQ